MIFPFNPSESKFELEIKKAEHQENQKFDKQEVVIFMKKMDDFNAEFSSMRSSNQNAFAFKLPFAYFGKVYSTIFRIQDLLRDFSFQE